VWKWVHRRFPLTRSSRPRARRRFSNDAARSALRGVLRRAIQEGASASSRPRTGGAVTLALDFGTGFSTDHHDLVIRLPESREGRGELDILEIACQRHGDVAHDRVASEIFRRASPLPRGSTAAARSAMATVARWSPQGNATGMPSTRRGGLRASARITHASGRRRSSVVSRTYSSGCFRDRHGARRPSPGETDAVPWAGVHRRRSHGGRDLIVVASDAIKGLRSMAVPNRSCFVQVVSTDPWLVCEGGAFRASIRYGSRSWSCA
jgi:hypothetical protein